MLLLSFLFTVVSLLFIYALMRDTGKHTHHARHQERRKQSSRQKPAARNVVSHVKDDSEVASVS